MSYYSGQHGQLFIKKASQSNDSNLVKIGSLRNWSLNATMAVLDTTTLQATDRTLINGVRSFTGSASLLYYKDSNTSNLKNLIQNTFKSTSKNETSFADQDFGVNTKPEPSFLRLRLDDGTARDIDLVCFITSFSVAVSVGDVVSSDISFEGSGAPMSLLP